MSRCQFENFDLTISGLEPPYHVNATYRQRSAQGVFYSDATQPSWQEFITRLSDLSRPAGEEALITVGSHLFQELMQEDILELWLTARTDLDRSPETGLRLRLMLHSPAVAALPWECLYDPRRKQVFGANNRISLVRVANHISYVGRSRPLEAKLPVKILLAVVEDPNAEMDTAAEVRRVEQTLHGIDSQNVTLAVISGRLSIHQLRKTLGAEQPDVLHLITHGQPDGLVLWDEDGSNARLASAASWQATLEQSDSVKLVLLNACLAGHPSADTPFADVAQRLLQAGVPAVIGMQFEIRDAAAVDFASFLYEALVAGPCPGAIDVAMGFARNNLYISAPDRVDYATPILWLNTEDGAVFHFDAASRSQMASTPATDPYQTPPPVAVDLASLKTWLASVPRWSEATLPVEGLTILRTRQLELHEAERLLLRLETLLHEQAEGKPRGRSISAVLARFQEQQRQIDRLTALLQELID